MVVLILVFVRYITILSHILDCLKLSSNLDLSTTACRSRYIKHLRAFLSGEFAHFSGGVSDNIGYFIVSFFLKDLASFELHRVTFVMLEVVLSSMAQRIPHLLQCTILRIQYFIVPVDR